MPRIPSMLLGAKDIMAALMFPVYHKESVLSYVFGCLVLRMFRT